MYQETLGAESTTYRPVGCSYSPVWGVESFTAVSDMAVKTNWGI